MALPDTAPANPIVSAHVTDPPPGAGAVLVLVDEKVRALVVPVTGRVPVNEMFAGRAKQIKAGLTAVSATVPVVSAVPLMLVPDVGCRRVILNVPFKVRVERQVVVEVVVVTIICPVNVPEYVVVVGEGFVLESQAAMSAATAAIAHTETTRMTASIMDRVLHSYEHRHDENAPVLRVDLVERRAGARTIL